MAVIFRRGYELYLVHKLNEERRTMRAVQCSSDQNIYLFSFLLEIADQTKVHQRANFVIRSNQNVLPEQPNQSRTQQQHGTESKYSAVYTCTHTIT